MFSTTGNKMKETVLINKHKSLNGKMASFNGYNMPLWYKSAKNEHLSVLKDVGIFDTSHMSFFTIEGGEVSELLDLSFSRVLDHLKVNHLIYGLFLDDKNFVIDDSVIYKFSENKFFVIVNCGMDEIVINHLKSFDLFRCKIVNYSHRLAKIDVQGPKSLKLLEKYMGEELFNNFGYFTFKGSFDNGNILISRSGYTGEFGFELYVESDKAPKLWDTLLELGSDLGITPCGLASRDSLRTGAGLPLSHQDIGPWPFGNTPWDFCVENRFLNSPFYTYSYVGYDVRKLHESTKGDVLFNKSIIGRVLTCVTEVSITRIDEEILSITSDNLPRDYSVKGLVSGFIRVNIPLEYGDIVILNDGKRELKVQIVKNIRPNRTARLSINRIRREYE